MKSIDEKISYYRLDKILKANARYNVIYGERSNGKTTAVLEHALIDYCESGYRHELAIIRRTKEDLEGMLAQEVFSNVISLGWVEKYTKGEYNSIYYYSSRWYLCKYSDDGAMEKKMKSPFAYAFGINTEEHYKSTAYPHIKTILFDEFITRKSYLPDEFVRFQSLLSTIIRLRTDVTIFMCGNSVNKFCPYFTEMGLTNVRKQKQGTIDVYTYGDTGLIVAVEYSDLPSKKKASNVYFAFNNPKLKMITTGAWEIDIYPHLPHRFVPKDIIFKFYIVFDGDILQADVVVPDEHPFIFIHRKTTKIQEDNEELVYSKEMCYKSNYRYSLYDSIDRRSELISSLFKQGKVFYQSNEIGEIVMNYIKETH